MSKGDVEMWAIIAYVLAGIVVIASIGVMYSYGSYEGGRYGAQQMINWPLVAGCIVSSLYSILFAVMFSVVRYIYIGKPCKDEDEEQIEEP